MDRERLLRWHREKCWTVEKVPTVEKMPNVMKHDRGGGIMLCGRFYANAAWWRLNCITYNVLLIMKWKKHCLGSSKTIGWKRLGNS